MTYALGSSDYEQQRLELQATLFEPYTLHLLENAGIGPGQQVLDIGCGAGDVSSLLAFLVGPTGNVVGIDADPRMVEYSRKRLQKSGFGNVEFRVSSLASGEIKESFDAVVGRMVSVFQPDPVAFIRNAAALARAGGVVAFIESAWTLPRVWSQPTLPSYDDLVERFIEVLREMGVKLDLGSGLISVFKQAGLAKPHLSTVLLNGGRDEGNLDLMLMTLEVIFRQARERGIKCPDAAELKRTYSGIRADAVTNHVQFNGPALVGGWVKVASIRN